MRRLALLALLLAPLVVPVPAGAGRSLAAVKRACARLCRVYRPLCLATDQRGHRRLYRLCWNNLLSSCRLTGGVGGQPTCTFPCGRDADCSFGRSCVQNQCIIPPLVGSGGGTECGCHCDNGRACTANAECGVDSLGIPNICGCPINPPCDGHGGRR